MDWIYIIMPAVGALIGGFLGSRMGGASGVAPTVTAIGALWGLLTAVKYRSDHRKGGDERGEFLTETKAYKKKMKKQDKADQKD